MAVKLYKATGPGGIAFYDGKTRYVVGKRLEVKNPDGPDMGACGRGLHASARIQDTIRFTKGDTRRCEFFVVEADEKNILAQDEVKTRVRALTVLSRVTGADLGIRRGRMDQALDYGYGSGYGSGYGPGPGSGGSGDGSGGGDGDYGDYGGGGYGGYGDYGGGGYGDYGGGDYGDYDYGGGGGDGGGDYGSGYGSGSGFGDGGE